MGTKLIDFQNEVNSFSSHFDVFIIAETWLKNEVEDAELGLDAFHIFRKDRKLSKKSLEAGEF